MLRSQAPRNALLLLLSVAVSIGAAESAVRLFVPVRDVGPSFTVHDPVMGKRIKRAFSAERITPEFRMRFSTNSLGFRGPEPDPSAQRPILFLGDSFTLGYGVSDGEEYPALIAAVLRRRYGSAAPPAVNAGIGDSGNGYWIKFLRHEAPGMRPRLVVLQLLDNDFADNVNERLFSLSSDGGLEELPVPAAGIMRRVQAVVEAVPGLSYSYLVGLLRQAAPARGQSARPAPGPATGSVPSDELTLRVVEKAIVMCEAQRWNVLGLLVGLPPARAAALTEIFARHGIPTVAIASKEERPDLYYRIDGHWRAGGHAYAAARLLEVLPKVLEL